MSELRENMADVVDDRAPGTTDTITLLRTGQTFYGEIEPIDDIALLSELGVDPRAAAWLYVSRRCSWVQLNAGDQLSTLGMTFQVLPKTAPRKSAEVMDKYLLMELTAKDAQ